MASHSSILAREIPWTEESGWATVHEVTKSQTWLSVLSTHTCNPNRAYRCFILFFKLTNEINCVLIFTSRFTFFFKVVYSGLCQIICVFILLLYLSCHNENICCIFYPTVHHSFNFAQSFFPPKSKIYLRCLFPLNSKVCYMVKCIRLPILFLWYSKISISIIKTDFF